MTGIHATDAARRPLRFAILIAVAWYLACVPVFAEDGVAENTTSSGDTVVSGAKNTGNAIGSTFRAIGMKAKEIGKAVGSGAAKAGKTVGKAAKEGGKAVADGITGKDGSENRIPPE